MQWPWSRREKRAGGYTDLLIAGAESWAAGSRTSATTTAAVEAAAGAWSRAFASASVANAPDDVVGALSPLTLAQIGRDLIRRGESALAISLGGNGAVMLTPAATWDVSGSTADPSSWVYRVDDTGPTGTRTRTLPSAAVIHAMYAYNPTRPWQGLGPLDWASLSATLHSRAEHALAEDVAASVGYVMPAPAGGENAADDDTDDDQLGALLGRLKALRGRLMVVDSMSGSWGGDHRDAPQQDWAQRRLGPEPDETLATLHGETARAIVAACGVPQALIFGGTGGASALREAWRQFLHGSVAPVARLVEHELRRKLDAPDLSLNFDSLFASDLSGRARAFQSLVGGGMDVAKAAALAGLMEA